MKLRKGIHIRIVPALSCMLLLGSCSEKYTTADKEGITIVQNEGGATLGYASTSGLKIITKDRYAFKELNKNGSLDAYEDW